MLDLKVWRSCSKVKKVNVLNSPYLIYAGIKRTFDPCTIVAEHKQIMKGGYSESEPCVRQPVTRKYPCVVIKTKVENKEVQSK